MPLLNQRRRLFQIVSRSCGYELVLYCRECHLGTSVIYFTTTKVVIPRLGEYDASQANYDEEEETSSHITPTEKKALFWANMSFLLLIVALIICCIPEGSWLRNAKTGSLIDDSFN